jgi:hypothetical protein
MGLSHEHVGPKILAKIKIYILTRAELLCRLCYEIPCNKQLLLRSIHLNFIQATRVSKNMKNPVICNNSQFPR